MIVTRVGKKAPNGDSERVPWMAYPGFRTLSRAEKQSISRKLYIFANRPLYHVKRIRVRTSVFDSLISICRNFQMRPLTRSGIVMLNYMSFLQKGVASRTVKTYYG